jgi:hypothetical protein
MELGTAAFGFFLNGMVLISALKFRVFGVKNY